MRKKGPPLQWQRLRYVAANMIDQKMKPVEIAKLLEVDVQTVREWKRRYLKGGRAALAARRTPGRPAELSASQRQLLAEMLLKTPAECGFEKYLWTQQLIADLIEREFGVSYHHDHIGVILKQMGFTHQKPQPLSRERDEARIEAWRARDWPTLLKKV